jgi:protein involved in polysaccharide export with SLBB domain
MRKFVKKYIRVVLLFTVPILLVHQVIHAQEQDVFDKERFLQLLQSGILLRLNPEEIKRKIAEAGLTEQEAVRLAKERQIDLEKYLGAEATTQATLSERRQPAMDVSPHSPSPPATPISLVLPEFAGRASGVEPFGFAIFRQAPTLFEPIVNVPTPPNYVLGPGDEIVLNVWGETQLNYTLTVARDGYILIPDVGKIQVAGYAIDQLKKILLQRMSAVYASLANGSPRATSFLDISIGKLRTIQLFVLGEARLPGGYSLSGLATAFTALYYAGGPNVNGSLRNIKLQRLGKTAATIDFYDFVLYGQREQDQRLQEGDILFIEPAGKRVAVVGNVKRPAIYELKPNERLGDLIRMAGGLRDDAYFRRVHVERIIPFAQRAAYKKDILDIDLTFRSQEELTSSTYELESSDVVYVLGIGNEKENRVQISGNVWKPGVFELSNGMTVRDLIQRADGVKENTFFERASILRTREQDLKKEIVPFNLARALEGDPVHNLPLQRLDEVFVYNDEMFRPTHTVTIQGAVRNPGTYRRTEGMTLVDLIVLAGGVQERADLQKIEVARIDTTRIDKTADIYHVALPNEYWKANNPHNMTLQDFDLVTVRWKPEYSELRTVAVSGEVMFPGVYALREEGERISDLLQRCGGLKPTAYKPGIRLIRTPGTGGIPARSPSIAESAITDSLGRPLPIPPRLAGNEISIEIDRVLMNPKVPDNLILEAGDELIVPKDPSVVYVQGQVNTPSSIPYKKGARLSYYLKQAGGLTRNADDDNIVVILPNGKKWEPSGFFLIPDPEILSGSTIIVPFKKMEKQETLPYIKELASILASSVTFVYIVWQITR